MRNVILILLLFIVASCNEAGNTSQSLNGNEANLPEELKGMKVYTVATGNLSTIEVAVLNDKIIGESYPQGKTQEHVLLIHSDETRRIRTINVSEIVSETDSIIVCKKE